MTFIALLPWMMLRQIGLSVWALGWAWRTRGRQWTFANGRLQIGYVGSAELLVTAGIFSERFTWLRWSDVAIDPGPVTARAQVLRALTTPPLASVAVTHAHEEHLGNAAVVAQHHGVPVWASAITAAAMRQPEVLPEGRRLLMGQPQPTPAALIRQLGPLLETPAARLEIIAADGHCPGQVALYEREHAILFAGDAFLDAIYTAPNRDSDAQAWIATLERFSAIPVATLVGAHGAIISRDPAFPVIAGVMQRDDPDRLIRDKLAFLTWAKAVVHAGEQRGLPFSVIEACLFPWARTWSWRTWFHDESFRLLTCGEFSRTHFVRSLSTKPHAVPQRFPPLQRLSDILASTAPELLRIHMLALRPGAVFGIAGSIAVCLGIALSIASVSGVNVASWRGIAQLFPDLIASGAWLPLAAIFSAWTWWWAVVGGALTRRMALAVIDSPPESFAQSLRRCLRPALYLPSALASLCLLAIGVAAMWPWVLLAVPPIWLCAGFLYAAMVIDDAAVGAALRGLGQRLRNSRRIVIRQALFLAGFACSTGLVYAIAALWCGLVLLVHGWIAPQPPRMSWPLFAAVAPVAFYALGYTTANLKSLQIWLYARP